LRGGQVVYTITLANAGPATAANTQLWATAPAELSWLSNAGDCTGTFPCQFGALLPGAQRTVVTTMAVPTNYPVPTPIVSSASVTTDTTDSNPGNNSASVTSRWGTFYTLNPCRVADTRDPASPNGPPILAAAVSRTMVLSGLCGVPAGATALALNVTVTGGTALGDLRLFPADVAMPLVSTINFQAGQTRANNAVVVASADGTGAITIQNDSAAPVHVIIDVAGYFE
jgi:uncharacterized repeat protein (TIGR01451 family)